MTNMKPMNFYPLEEALQTAGCPVCRLLQQDAAHFLDSLLYEHIADLNVMQNFRASRGLCNQHGWQFGQQRGANLGVLMLYGVALDEVIRILDGEKGASGRGGWLRSLTGSSGSGLAGQLAPRETCACCEWVDEREKHHIQTFIDHFDDFALRYTSSDGLCLAHFRGVLLRISDETRARQIISAQRAIWGRILDQIDLVRVKVDPHSGAQEFGTEAESWSRVLESISSAIGVYGTDRKR